MATNRIERLLDPTFIEGLRDLPMEELRAKRVECSEVEVGLSMLRRVVQGRLDIVVSDLQRRAGGEPADLSALVDQLPQILSDHGRPPGMGRLPTLFVPSDQDDLTAEVDAVADPRRLSSLPEMEESDVRALADALGELERRTSDQRQLLFDRIAILQEEIVRRYKAGEANVDSLLK
jgi:hypothetical protein